MNQVPTMDPSMHEKINRLATEALTMDRQARQPFLDDACDQEPQLRSAIKQMLDAHQRMGDFLEKPIVECLSDWLKKAAYSKAEMPTCIGPYKILEHLAEGGMGSVYLTERDTGSGKQKLALKLIRAGLSNQEMRARFAMEHHALARMDHPHLARLFEAGTTNQDEPYFTMEYVPGLPISEFCKKHALGLKERLGLFQQVCKGVRHAHQRGIIHRDLKPSNVLAFFQDDKPIAKIIDFGIARAVGGRPLADFSLHTARGSILGTPSYMSPEQVDSGGLEVDIRTDVYALGAMLYEMLTGAAPFVFNEVSLSEMLRIIKEQDPLLPSRRLYSSDSAYFKNAPVTVAQLRGDLDRIILKAMAKDSRLRYDSVSTLMADIEAFQQGLPIAAGPRNNGYRLRKAIARHRLIFALVGLVFLSLVLGLSLTLSQAARARQDQLRAEREAAQQQVVKTFLGKLLTASNPGDANREIKLVTLLDRAAGMIDQDLKDNPLARANTHELIGTSYESLGWYEQAHVHYDKDLTIKREELGPEHLETLASMERVATILLRRKKFEEAELYFKQTIELMRHKLDEMHPFLLRTRLGQANTMRRRNRPGEALPIYEDVIEKARQSQGPNHELTQNAIQGMAYALRRVGRTDEAVTHIKDLLKKQQESQGPNHPRTLGFMGTLADLLYDQGKYQDAEMLYRNLINLSRQVLGKDHVDTLSSEFGLMLVLRSMNRTEEAETLCRSILERRIRYLGDMHPDTMKVRNNLGSLLIERKRFTDAELILSRNLSLHQTFMGDTDPRTLSVGNNLVHLYFEMGRHQKALLLAQQLLEAGRDAKGIDRIYLMATYGETLQKLGRFQEASDQFVEVVKIAKASMTPGGPAISAFLCLYGECLTKTNHFESAELVLLESYENLKKEPSNYLVRTEEALLDLYGRWGKPEEMAKWTSLRKTLKPKGDK